MAAQKGSAFLLKDNSTGSPVTLGGMRSTSMSINGETVDITTKESATFDGVSGNDIGRVLLANAGIRSMSISASGVFTDSASEETTRVQAFSGDIKNYDLLFCLGNLFFISFWILLFISSSLLISKNSMTFVFLTVALSSS